MPYFEQVIRRFDGGGVLLQALDVIARADRLLEVVRVLLIAVDRFQHVLCRAQPTAQLQHKGKPEEGGREGGQYQHVFDRCDLRNEFGGSLEHRLNNNNTQTKVSSTLQTAQET